MARRCCEIDEEEEGDDAEVEVFFGTVSEEDEEGTMAETDRHPAKGHEDNHPERWWTNEVLRG